MCSKQASPRFACGVGFWQVTRSSLESIRDIIQSIVSLCHSPLIVSLCHSPLCISYYMCDCCEGVMLAKMLDYCSMFAKSASNCEVASNIQIVTCSDVICESTKCWIIANMRSVCEIASNMQIVTFFAKAQFVSKINMKLQNSFRFTTVFDSNSNLQRWICISIWLKFYPTVFDSNSLNSTQLFLTQILFSTAECQIQWNQYWEDFTVSCGW